MKECPRTPSPINGPLAYRVASLVACQPVLTALEQKLHGFGLEAVVAPHFISGPLDARQPRGFLRWHMGHYLHQIGEILRLRSSSVG